MFKAANPYDEIVVKATDENLTSENWQLNLDVCDKVTSDGATGSRNCVAAILKRLVHRNANVQLYSLTLSDALSKNCGEIAHQELASRSFTQTLQRIITDRNTHDTVKKKSLALIKEWNSEWGNDESLGLIRETMESLKKQGFSFTQGEQKEVPPTEPSSEQLRAEDEELRKVLELSLQDQGGRGGTGYSAGPPVAGSSSSSAAPAAAAASSAPAASNGYTPSQPYSQQQADQSSRQTSGSSAYNPASATGASSSSLAVATPAATQSSQPAASRVRALYDFTPTESGELAFRQGDIIRVLDSVYEHWWRGEINGEVGIFPVNFVEVLPDPTPADVQREAEMEAKIFAQANDIDRLLSKLRGLDPSRDNLAEDEELQELYQSSLSMRPKIVKLIDRYNLKVNELRSMNEKFVRARSTFDAMMEQSLAKYNSANAASSVSTAPQRGDYAHAAGGEYGYAPPMAGQPGYQQQQQYHQQYNQQQPQQVPYQQTPQAGSGSEGQQQPSTAQQQHEYAQSWAAWYAQNGYQQPSPGQGPGQGQGQSHHLQHSASADGSITAPPPNVNDPAYSQWYYSNQQQQQQQQQRNTPQHLAGSTGATTTASAPSAPMTMSSAYNYGPSATAAAPGGGSGDDSTSSAGPHDQDKRAMFERARAEAEAYHRAHQQQQQQQQQQHHMTNSNSQNELPLQ